MVFFITERVIFRTLKFLLRSLYHRELMPASTAKSRSKSLLNKVRYAISR